MQCNAMQCNAMQWNSMNVKREIYSTFCFFYLNYDNH
jgi:hypothetical protein